MDHDHLENGAGRAEGSRLDNTGPKPLTKAPARETKDRALSADPELGPGLRRTSMPDTLSGLSRRLRLGAAVRVSLLLFFQMAGTYAYSHRRLN
jgi:hypothetical protein